MARPKKNMTTPGLTGSNEGQESIEHPSVIDKPIKSGKVGRPKGAIIPGTDKLFVRDYPMQTPLVDVMPEPKADIEDTLEWPDDAISKHQYPPPRKDPRFRKYWGRLIDSIVERANFKVAHLPTLEILCDLYVEYEELQKFIRTNGTTYKSYSRAGMTHKPFPQVVMVRECQSRIREYTKMLGLLLRKDESIKSHGEDDNWA